MNVSVKRMRAIFIKDYKEFSRNYAVSTMVLMPLILAFFYQNAGASTLDMYFLPINMTFAVVTTFIQACLIAEEKESNTLRSLMMSPASMADILIGKSTLVFSITLVIIALTITILGFTPANLLILTVGLMISAVFYIGLGIICGLFTKTVMEASVAVLPVIGVFSIGALALGLAETYPVLEVLKWLPSVQLILLEGYSEAGYTSDIVIALSVITAWTVAVLVVAGVLFKKRMKDE
ncbi:ABC-2 type transport system permease [Jeotgalibacillus alimentarius]|uniref:ABC-2 type transport system permease n=1 Tax=Jeotgalibacillus alimentarius TaxID=135826 RepID=A0A0C2W4Q1_9BACL|nr:ABC transporter permease subunit [Jeotgalibacillus alimentarius]KIL51566.1 ABC-2 type transport system permease [Jeotgalibacillus alimentarius]